MPSNWKKNFKDRFLKQNLNLFFSFFLLFFLVVFALKPSLSAIIKLKKELKEKKEANQILEQKIIALQQAEKIYGQVANDVNLVNQVLPREIQFLQAAKRLNYLFYTNNLFLENILFEKFELLPNTKGNEIEEKEPKEENFSSVKKLGFKCSLKGDYQSLKKLLAASEKLDRLITFNSLNLSKSNSRSDNQLEIQLTGYIYWLEKNGEK